MKKLSLALITGGALCAFGVLLGGAALAMTGFEFSKVVTTMKYENKTAAYEPSLLAGIEIAAEDLKVVVSPSPDEQVHLSYWESALDATTIEVDGGMLRFRHTVSDSWLDNFIHGFWSSFARYRHVIEIKIPASFAGSLSVTNENAALEASGLTALSSAAFRSKNGALELTDILCLGGLTAVRELRRILPGEDIVYFGDTGRVPYGTRGVDVIVRYAKQDIAFLLEQNVKYVMAACGTVSSTLSEAYTRTLPVPYTGVVQSAAAAAVRATRTGLIGVIGTPATVKSGSYNAAIAALMPGARIVATACPLFVPLVENGYFGADNAVTRLVARDYLKDIRAAGVDTLILGCTHYPLIAPIIADLMGPEVALIDPGRETALAARDALASAGLLREGRAGTARYYVSDTTESFAQLSDWFLGEYAGGPVTRISVDGYPVEQGAST